MKREPLGDFERSDMPRLPRSLTGAHAAGVPRAIFTRCGRAIVAGPPDIEAHVSVLGRARHIDVRVAYDGLRIHAQ